jgi:N6-L-threonylcarbamoyladenine synthase
MIVLGIDTSCDDTSLALVRDKNEILSHIVSSQTDLHALFGGIVPELASRKHIELIESIYRKVLAESGVSHRQIDAVSVTTGPGLIGSILVGLCFAKGLCLALDRPLVGVNHVQAHALSILLEKEVEFPFLALVVSGGHTIILHIDDPYGFRVIGTTRDDAAGEAFDKIAKFLGIGYPGGKVIEEYARQGRGDAVNFPRPMIDDNNYDFSFSGLKTSFINYIKNNKVTDDTVADILASFQEAAFDVLRSKVLKAARATAVRRVVVGGGVAANGRLRQVFADMARKEGIEVSFSSPQYCTDNGAMIALTGSFNYTRGIFSPLDTRAFSRMKMA